MSTLANLYSDVKTLCQQWFYTKNEVDTALNDLVDTIYPVGSIYMSVNSTSPQTLFGGTWEQIQDKFLLASGSTYSNGATGGSATVSLTQSEMPRHTHTQNAHNHDLSNSAIVYNSGVSRGINNNSTSTKCSLNSALSSNLHTLSETATNQYTGGTGTSQSASNGVAHENMPPYLAVNVWKRTA